MGFAQVAAFAIIATGTVVFGSVAYVSWQNAADDVRDAQRIADARAAQQTGEMLVANPAYIPGLGRVTLTITNTGDVPLDAGSIDVILDGEWETDDITSALVGGVDSDVWSPLTVLVVVLENQDQSPLDVVVATEDGTKAYWRQGV